MIAGNQFNWSLNSEAKLNQAKLMKLQINKYYNSNSKLCDNIIKSMIGQSLLGYLYSTSLFTIILLWYSWSLCYKFHPVITGLLASFRFNKSIKQTTNSFQFKFNAANWIKINEIWFDWWSGNDFSQQFHNYVILTVLAWP